MFEKFKNNFLKTQKGSVAVEHLITTPLTLLMTFFSIMVIIFVIDFHLISTSASALCQQMNMGDTGYTYAASNGDSIYSLRSNIYYNTGSDPDAAFLVGTAQNGHGNVSHYVQISSTNTANGIFGKAANYYVEKLDKSGALIMPYVDITDMSCRVYYNGSERTGFNTNKGSTESGDLIKVNIKYKFAGFFTVNVNSYGFID